MIFGIGIDMIEIERVQKAVERNARFVDKVFTPGEVAYSEGKKNKFQHLAARFAAKEAFIKALGRGVPWASVEVVNLPSGKPTLAVRDAETFGFTQTHVSLTHLATYAVAVVILEK
ncbi:MAG: holo-ACP synthase [Candidatus Aminicenantes bacterium]|nr:holo-ACP synthase [Candidatus Aminicenantes bacterium]